MRTTDRIIDFELGQPATTFFGRVASGWTLVASALRVFRNRMEVNQLHELDDNQLRDIGLTRADLNSALLNATFFEDPSSQLARTARQRARLTLAD
ncbi:DUF1127 domain-containing protein [Rhizobium sp. BK251]|uniref:DUF1127 domain-containing protein n=1 Tax=Rhizobium sp. BK251 TaxID=2512125 RepID=UPI001051E0AB|nr:DUF1127 domain-containing protein [Rhizobium sp. BK251]TCL75775.1 uncharacterized protein DUF1127 [Rhizobium sp. BK251]